MAKGLDCSKEKVREIINLNENMLAKYISIVLEKISQNINVNQNEKKIVGEEAKCHTEIISEEINFEKFINFQQDIPCHMYFD